MKHFLLLIAASLAVTAFANQDEFGENGPDSREDLSIPVPRGGKGNVRLRCTDNHLKLYHNATTCHDERTSVSCQMIFAQSLSSNPANRDPRCDDPLLEDVANQCRKTCGICCEDPNYACQNDNSEFLFPPSFIDISFSWYRQLRTKRRKMWNERICSYDGQVLSCHLWALSHPKMSRSTWWLCFNEESMQQRTVCRFYGTPVC